MKSSKMISIRWQFLAVVAGLIVTVSSLVGAVTYQKAEDELVQAGILDLQQTVDGAIAVAQGLEDQVQRGEMTRAEAIERARTIILGPLKPDGKMRDMSHSRFLYKSEGYMWAYDDQCVGVMHPFGLEGLNQRDFRLEDGTYLLRELVRISKLPEASERIMTYQWKNPGEAVEREQMSYVEYFAPWGLTFGIAVYPEEFYGSLPALRFYLIGGVLLFSLLSVLAFTLIINKKVRIINLLNRNAGQIRDGHLHVEPLEIAYRDEIGGLAHSINEMVDTLRSMIVQVKESSTKVAELSAEIGEYAQETKVGSEQISAVVHTLATGAAQQAESVEQSVETIQIMSKGASHITEHSRTVASTTMMAAQQAKEGNHLVSGTKEQMGAIYSTVNGLAS
ncbi:MAG: cache domain-containing protein [Clostridia bacterium]